MPVSEPGRVFCLFSAFCALPRRCTFERCILLRLVRILPWVYAWGVHLKKYGKHYASQRLQRKDESLTRSHAGQNGHCMVEILECAVRRAEAQRDFLAQHGKVRVLLVNGRPGPDAEIGA
jgi:hypothetical protein